MLPDKIFNAISEATSIGIAEGIPKETVAGKRSKYITEEISMNLSYEFQRNFQRSFQRDCRDILLQNCRRNIK